jgi:hypothetical protein
MKETIAQFLKIKDFPFFIKDTNGKKIYSEKSNEYWFKKEYDKNGNEMSFENSSGFWFKKEYDKNGNEIYFENSSGFWSKSQYNNNSNLIYYENSSEYWVKIDYDNTGNLIYFENSYKKSKTIIDKRPKVIELTLEEIADKLGLNVENIRIKD